MKNSVGDRIRLHHIYDAILEIEKYTMDQSHEDFINESIIQAACIRQLEIIGEAANHLSDEIKSLTNEIQWREIIGLRNLLIHEYFGVDLDIVWEIIRTDIPLLKSNIKSVLNKFEE
jgi:uncharacterized protein with HEPN domain